MTATAVGGGRDTLSLPRIDRYFPQCKIAAMEAVARHRFGVRDFGKLYGKHTFRYRRPDGPIRYRDNGVELDLEIHRVPLAESELEDGVLDIYGIATEDELLTSLDAYVRYCQAELGRGAPVISNFDLMFIAERREYRKVSTPHVVVLFGHDTETGSFRAAEQMIGEIAIGRRDLEECFARVAASDGGMRVWRMRRVRQAERDLSTAELRATVRANIENLASGAAMSGLRGLEQFVSDLTEFVSSDGHAGRPFAIPGLWVFSHERHLERKWLREAAALLEPPPNSVAEFDRLLSELFKSWLGLDYLLEKCLVAESGRGLRGLPAHFAPILSAERAALQRWLELDRLLGERR